MKHIVKHILELIWILLQGVFFLAFFTFIGIPYIWLSVIIELFDKEQKQTGGSVDDFGFPGDF